MQPNKFLPLIIFSIFLITTVSAATGFWTSWENLSNSRTIDYGETAEFDIYASCANPPLTISVKLYDSEDNQIYVFLDRTIQDSAHTGYIVINPVYQVNQFIYETDGDFEVRIKYSDAVQNTRTEILYLTVNPAEEPEPPENNPPVLDSIPNQQINETDFYSYHVTATDADNDSLTFSLTQTPSTPNWLSINPNTGLITGTAPEVYPDIDFDIEVMVSDGENFTTQDYVLTVKNIPEPEPEPEDTTPPTINITYPQNKTYNDYVTQLSYTVSDPNLDSCWYSLNGGENITTECALVITDLESVEGSNTWIVYANDTYGNVGSKSVTFIVQLAEDEEPSDGDKKVSGKKSTFNYKDIDEERYLEQFNKEQPIIDLSGPVSEESKTNWQVLLFGAVIFILISAIIITLVKIFKTRE